MGSHYQASSLTGVVNKVIILVVQNTDLLILIVGEMAMALAHFVKILTWPINCNPGPLGQNTDVARWSKY